VYDRVEKAVETLEKTLESMKQAQDA